MKLSRVLVSVVCAVALLSPAAQGAEPDKKIERVFKAKCASCHGADGKAQTEKGKKMKMLDLTTAEFKAKKDEDIKKAILEGTKSEKDGVKKEMDPFKDELKPDQVDGLIVFIKALK